MLEPEISQRFTVFLHEPGGFCEAGHRNVREIVGLLDLADPIEKLLQEVRPPDLLRLHHGVDHGAGRYTFAHSTKVWPSWHTIRRIDEEQELLVLPDGLHKSRGFSLQILVILVEKIEDERSSLLIVVLRDVQFCLLKSRAIEFLESIVSREVF